MKLIVGNFNQEKALEGGFSVMVKTDGSFAALVGSLSIFICIHLRSDKRPGKVNLVMGTRSVSGGDAPTEYRRMSDNLNHLLILFL